MFSYKHFQFSNSALTASLIILSVATTILIITYTDNETPVPDLPDYFTVMNVPADNPVTSEKVQLGRHLFYDKRLSFNNTIACASCHLQEKAFTDGKRFSLGATGEATTHSAMSLTNVAFNKRLGWADNRIYSLSLKA